MSDYYILITDAGAALEASAHAAGTTVALSEFGVCDGGAEFVPDPAQTTFANEVYHGAISSLSVSTDNASVLVAECVIPATSGGYTIRGIALYAADGTLYATGNYPDQPKPAADSGYSASLQILAELAVSDTADITLQVTDGSFLTETQGNALYLRQDEQLGEIAAQGTDAQTTARGNIGCGTAATHAAEDFLPGTYTAPVTSVNTKTGAVTLTASDVGALPSTYTAPVTSVNGKTGAVSLSSTDVGAYSKSESDGRYNLKNTATKSTYSMTSKDASTGVMEVVMSNITVAPNTNVSVTFPTAFPSVCVAVVTSYDGSGHGDDSDSTIAVTSYSRTGCVLHAYNAQGKFMLIAKGY